MTTDLPDAFETLSARELECLRGVAAHKRSSQIAYDLGLKHKTVDTYVASAMRKLGYSDRDSAARALLAREQPVSTESPSTIPHVAPIKRGGFFSWLFRLFPWPVPTPGRPTNDLTASGKIGAIIVASTFLLAAAALYLLAIRMLSERL